jgi:uncharacterized HAD superfamily protein
MNIGIDLDEVIVPTFRGIIKFYNKNYGGNILFENYTKYYYDENGIGQNREEAIKINRDFFNSKEFEEMKPIEGSEEAITQLNLNGHKLFIITSREESSKEKTKSLLNKYFQDIKFELIFSGDLHKKQVLTKADICLMKNITIMIEDSDEFALACAQKGINVIVPKRPWNGNIIHEKMFIVNNWKEILKKVNELEEKQKHG